MIVIVLIILFNIIGGTADDVGDSATNLTSNRFNESYDYNGADVFPLTSFFKKKGIILLAVMAGLAITVIITVLPKGK